MTYLFSPVSYPEVEGENKRKTSHWDNGLPQRDRNPPRYRSVASMRDDAKRLSRNGRRLPRMPFSCRVPNKTARPGREPPAG